MVVIQIDTARHFEGAPQRFMVTVHRPTPLDVHQVRAFNATFYRQRTLRSTWQAMHLLSARLAVVTQSSGTFLQPGGQFSVLCTAGSAAMATAAKEPRVQHEAVNLSIGERVHIQKTPTCITAGSRPGSLGSWVSPLLTCRAIAAGFVRLTAPARAE